MPVGVDKGSENKNKMYDVLVRRAKKNIKGGMMLRLRDVFVLIMILIHYVFILIHLYTTTRVHSFTNDYHKHVTCIHLTNTHTQAFFSYTQSINSTTVKKE